MDDSVGVFWNRPMWSFSQPLKDMTHGLQLLGKGKGIYTNDTKKLKFRLIKEIAFELWYLL